MPLYDENGTTIYAELHEYIVTTSAGEMDATLKQLLVVANNKLNQLFDTKFREWCPKYGSIAPPAMYRENTIQWWYTEKQLKKNQ